MPPKVTAVKCDSCHLGMERTDSSTHTALWRCPKCGQEVKTVVYDWEV